LDNNIVSIKHPLLKNDKIFQIYPINIKKNKMNVDIKIIFMSSIKLETNEEESLFWKAHKEKILSNFAILDDKYFWQNNLANKNLFEINRFYRITKSLLRFEIVTYLKKIYDKKFVLIGEDWRKYSIDSLKSNYDTKRNKKITLIGIVSKKNSILYSSANIKLLIPNIKEADPAGVVPTSSTIIQLSIGDALAVATMEQRNFGKLDFKKFHPSGTLGTRLKTAEDLMITKNKLPLINENKLMNIGLKIISKKKLGVLIVQNKKGKTVGIITDGDIKRANNKYDNINNLKVRKIMSKNPISIEKNTLAVEALDTMNSNKITGLCVHNKSNFKKTVGFLHIHNILEANIQ